MKYLFTLLCIGIMLYAGAQNRQRVNPLLKELTDQKDQQVLAAKLKTLEDSQKEEDVKLLADYYNATGNKQKNEEITKLIMTRFPNGAMAFDEAANNIYNERDPLANEKRLKALIATFSSNPALANNRMFNASRYYVAITFLGKNKPEKVKEYLEAITDTTYKTNAYSYAAREAIGTGDYVLGEQLIRKTFADVARRGNVNPADMVEYSRIAGHLFYLNGKYKEGFPYAKAAYDGKSLWKDVKPMYLDYLVANHDYKEAYPMMEEAIRTGNASAEVKAQFKNAYVAAKGSDAGFTEYEASLYTAMKESIKAELAKKMMNEQAFDFHITDLNGKAVSLSDFRGKTVVLDFWATWCAPCKASFPNMQAAVTKYKNDPNVVFLFIHTWETNNTPAKDAGSYIRDKKFTFNVLIDAKDPVTKANNAAVGYKLKGIPAKFIIDKNGKIRFNSLGGGAGGNDAFVEEISTMIELAKAA
ncbi:TlpA family protein disulfide reductase [Mucilaginibacter mali]|uniref:TlpA family protein disulfide reductase n=1 Tax=Mucilaginibacter mali TaxID=2740462 RepID=A0A7D4TQC6_9SPHI|nr:TlpA disulfide reductase family protein [Mucilaginibacter mali]QKJ32593.1 TlpA family protein disulfide reductase [Mucilaginibacter mali]